MDTQPQDKQQAAKVFEQRKAQQIKDGAVQPWEETFTHPVHGDLTFKGPLPDTAAMTRQAMARDELMADMDLGATPRGYTLLLVNAQAGILTLLDRPEVDRKQIEEDDMTRVETVLYDPRADVIETFPVLVWETFSNWRAAFLTPDTVGAVKNSSGGTTSDGSSESSSAG